MSKPDIGEWLYLGRLWFFVLNLSECDVDDAVSCDVTGDCFEFDRLRLWQSNGASFGHLIFRQNLEIWSRAVFFLVPFSFSKEKVQTIIH